MPKDMVDMKRSGKTREMAVSADNEYSYGLCIRLENEELDKLGMKRVPEPGSKLYIEAVAVVKSVHESKEAGEDPDRGVSLQITQMEVSRKYKDED